MEIYEINVLLLLIHATWYTYFPAGNYIVWTVGDSVFAEDLDASQWSVDNYIYNVCRNMLNNKSLYF